MEDAIQARPRSSDRPPTVVIFGAGITGLTAAHELIERGFRVQVVERTSSHDQEYGVEVGGLAANQGGVIKADLERLHPYLFPTADDGYCRSVLAGEIVDPDVETFLAEIPVETDDPDRLLRRQTLRDLAWRLRGTPLARSRHRLNLTQTLRFRTADGDQLADAVDREMQRLTAYLERGRRKRAGNPAARAAKRLEEEFLGLTDERGISNREKLDAVAMRIARGLLRRADRIADDFNVAELFSPEGHREHLLAIMKDLPLAEIFFRREMLLIEVRGHTNPDLGGATARDLGLLRARFVRDLLGGRLEALLGTDEVFYRLRHRLSRILHIEPDDATEATRQFLQGISRHLVAVSQGAAVPLGRRRAGRRRSDRVDFLVVEAPLPGEHGYRYFPAYYRHLFDTMRRTPMLDDKGNETSESAFDQLVTPESVTLSLTRDQRPLPIARQRFRSFEELRAATSALLDGIGLEPRDIQIFLLRVFTFMTSCKERRRRWEDQSWIEFLRGQTRLSETFTKFHQDTALALLSMDADEADAYSYALNAVQLLLDYRGDGAGIDMTLNGPTSHRWLRPWKKYLVRQGVEFFQGELVDLVHVPETGEVLPIAVWHADPPRIKDPQETEPRRAARLRAAAQLPQPERPGTPYAGYDPGRHAHDGIDAAADFYVLALPFEHAGRIACSFDTRHRNVLSGDWARLAAFDRTCIPRDDEGHDLVQCHPDQPVRGTLRDGRGKPMHAGYPLRDLSGIQFFFPNNVQIGRGHVIHAASDWGLTSIAQATHWRTRLSHREGFLGQLSVDIGNFYREHRIDFERRHAVTNTFLGPRDAPYKKELALPKTAWGCQAWEIPLRVWDQILASDESALDPPTYYHMDDGIVLQPVTDGASEFYPAENRTPFLINLPGQWRLRPGLGAAPRRGDAQPFDDGAADVAYEVSNVRWVLAGTYMATHTRLMTMEACNESARHAVNAILEAIRRDETPGREGGVYNSHGKQLGRRCEIFDPYDHEVDDFRAFKTLDKALLDEGLPHFVEILGIDRLVESAPRDGALDPTRLGKIIDAARSTQRQLGTLPGLPSFPETEIRDRLLKGLDALGDIPGLEKIVAAAKAWVL